QQRPEEEWIRVSVPPTVDAATWQAANEMLAKNRRMASRNAIEPYLLTGLVKCADCGYTYTGTTHKKKRGKLRGVPYRGYRCSAGAGRPLFLSDSVKCTQSHISARILDNAVWSVVCSALLDPQVLIEALRAEMFDERNAQ